MAEGKEKDIMVDLLQMCKANCTFMSVAINRTVDFAKSSSDRALTAKMEPVSVDDAVQWAVTCLNTTQNRVSIEVKPLPAGVCNFIVTDKHWLMENILCYLSNAVKYSTGGKVTLSTSLCISEEVPEDIVGCNSNSSLRSSALTLLPNIGRSRLIKTIAVHPKSSGGNGSSGSDQERELPPPQLRITVEDEGIGIADDSKLLLFQPFQQTMRHAGGTGLGLYSLSKRVEALKGKFGVEKRADGRQGSKFWFSVPYSPDETFSAEISKSVEERFEQSTRHYKRADSGEYGDSKNFPSALVVEDSVVISKSTARMLKKAGYDVHVAENGAIGLEKMKLKQYSTVIMDLQMPIMDGMEATRWIRAFESEESYVSSNNGTQFIIGASANGADDVMQDALNSGMNMFVPKPFSVADLMNSQAISMADADDAV